MGMIANWGDLIDKVYACKGIEDGELSIEWSTTVSLLSTQDDDGVEAACYDKLSVGSKTPLSLWANVQTDDGDV